MWRKLFKNTKPAMVSLVISLLAAFFSLLLYLFITSLWGGVETRGAIISILIPLTIAPPLSYFIMRIIAQLAATEEALREHKDVLQILTDNMADLVSMCNENAVFTYVSPTYESALGYGPDELIGRQITNLAHPDDITMLIEVIAERYATLNPAPVAIEYRMIHKNGTILWFETKGKILFDDEGNNIGAVFSTRDINERKQIESEKFFLEKQLHQAQKMEAIGTLASGIAHDFNNILQAVSGYVELLRGRLESDEKNLRYVNEIDNSVGRASDLVEHLLTFSRKVEPELKPVDLNEEVGRTIKILERTIPKMIAIESYLADDLWAVKADSSQLERVLVNLATNARDAMPDGGRLVIETERIILDEDYCKTHLEFSPGDYVVLRVSDTGHGMEREVLDRIFEPFFTTKDVGQGTGLGMSMIYGIVKAHGGQVNCYSEPGKGTVFNIYFPALKDVGLPAPKSEPVSLEDVGGDLEMVLVVDDEEPILEVAKEILEGRGYRAVTAASGEEALELFKSRNPRIDLVILDLGMPGMGGRRCLAGLMEIDPRVPVIVASGYSEKIHAREVLEAGARGFVRKPYRMDDMLKKIREVLDA